jgi:hypothetical protein
LGLCADRYREVRMAAHRHPAVRAELVLAAVDRSAARTCGDAGLAQDRHRPPVGEHVFQSPDLPVDLPERGELCEHERVVALSEAVQVEDEAAEVSVGELSRLAQKREATPGSSA